jgi:hypothetical protein
MIWLTWRQFRAQALTALAVLAVTATYLLITGLQMHHTYSADLATCTPQSDCSDVLNQFRQGYDTAFNLIELLAIVAPGLIGMFWGAPLIGRELETGTNQLVWNQSVTRTRWLAVKLAGIGAASIATVGLLSYLLTWWAGSLDQITGKSVGRSCPRRPNGASLQTEAQHLVRCMRPTTPQRYRRAGSRSGRRPPMRRKRFSAGLRRCA